MSLHRLAVTALSVALLLLAGAGAVAASERSAVIATVQQFATGINSGDMRVTIASCASPAIIIDDFPPHIWQGPTACADWAHAFEASNKSVGETNDIVTLGTPSHVDITGGVAYVVVPASHAYKLKGKPNLESGAVFTLVLHKLAAGWRIAGWTWAGGH